MADDLIERVRLVIAKSNRIPLESVTIDSTFEGLGMDSLDRMNLLFALEEEFDISIPDEEAKSISSVRAVAAGIDTILSNKLNDADTAKVTDANTSG